MHYTNHYQSPLGGITLASDGQALTGLWFDGQKYFADNLPENYEERSLPVFDDTKRWLDIYFSGRDPGFKPELSLDCSPFRRDVCEVMLGIGYGQTLTYGQIAALVAEKRGLGSMSAQAVGGAVGHNSISLIIPCHRVLGAGGNLTGYAGGLDRKIQLLTLEKVDMSRLHVPSKGTAL